MNLPEHLTFFRQEMKRRNYSHQTIENYASCLVKFFTQSIKDHPKNINETDIRNFLATFDEPNTQRAYHSAIKKFIPFVSISPINLSIYPIAKKAISYPLYLAPMKYKPCLMPAPILSIKQYWHCYTVAACGYLSL